MNWLLLVTKLPMVIAGTMAIVQKIKSATGSEKKAAVLEAIPESIALLELGLGRDVLNDPVIAELISAYIDAEAVALKAKAALKAGLLVKAPPPSPPV